MIKWKDTKLWQWLDIFDPFNDRNHPAPLYPDKDDATWSLIKLLKGIRILESDG